MTLVDASVWINHLRANDRMLEASLDDKRVLMHPMAIWELACGNLPDRECVLDLLKGLPHVLVADYGEVLFFVEQHRRMEREIGCVDAHVVAATALIAGARLWTTDRRLREFAAEMDPVHWLAMNWHGGHHETKLSNLAAVGV